MTSTIFIDVAIDKHSNRWKIVHTSFFFSNKHFFLPTGNWWMISFPAHFTLRFNGPVLCIRTNSYLSNIQSHPVEPGSVFPLIINLNIEVCSWNSLFHQIQYWHNKSQIPYAFSRTIDQHLSSYIESEIIPSSESGTCTNIALE